jgi:hypothetical protein
VHDYTKMPGWAHFSVELDLSETPEDFLQHPRKPLSLMPNLHRSTAKKPACITARRTASTELGGLRVFSVFPERSSSGWVSPSRPRPSAAPWALIDSNGETRVLLGVLKDAVLLRAAISSLGESLTRLYCTRTVVDETASPFRHLTRQIEQDSN